VYFIRTVLVVGLKARQYRRGLCYIDLDSRPFSSARACSKDRSTVVGVLRFDDWAALVRF
jgi:hypothetical protein